MSETLFLIWWTNQSDWERIERAGLHLEQGWPLYLSEQFEDRGGRNGRGRLWVYEGFAGDKALKGGAKWDDEKPQCKMAADAGGIVIRPADAQFVQWLPGFVTRLDMDPPR